MKKNINKENLKANLMAFAYKKGFIEGFTLVEKKGKLFITNFKTFLKTKFKDLVNDWENLKPSIKKEVLSHMIDLVSEGVL